MVSHTDDLSTQDAAPTRLSLLAPLPAADSPDARAVAASLPGVHMGLCLHRDALDAPSSYIIQSAASQSRTVVSANTLEEMSVGEFEERVRGVVPGAGSTGQAAGGDGMVWIHFEGRNPGVVLQCVRWLRRTYRSGRVWVSVECEKPEREGMRDVAALADVVFYSRLWAEVCPSLLSPSLRPPHPLTTPHQAHAPPHTPSTPLTPSAFLTAQIPHTLPRATLLCTWGSAGAALLQKAPGGMHTRASVAGWTGAEAGESSLESAARDSRGLEDRSLTQDLSLTQVTNPPQPIDTVGAGDTFIAGMLYALSLRWRPDTALAYANEVAGRKVVRRGFGGLGEEMRGWGGGEGKGGDGAEGV